MFQTTQNQFSRNHLVMGGYDLQQKCFALDNHKINYLVDQKVQKLHHEQGSIDLNTDTFQPYGFASSDTNNGKNTFYAKYRNQDEHSLNQRTKPQSKYLNQKKFSCNQESDYIKTNNQRDPCRVFVGGVGQATNENTIRTHFSKYGKIENCMIVTHRKSGKSRGFAFITYSNPDGAIRAIEARHKIDDVVVECRPALSKNEARDVGPHDSFYMPTKIFVGGLPDTIKEDDLLFFFSKFGEIESVQLAYDKANHRQRGFGFIIFKDITAVKEAIGRHSFSGKQIEAKHAIPRQLNTNGQQESNVSNQVQANDNESKVCGFEQVGRFQNFSKSLQEQNEDIPYKYNNRILAPSSKLKESSFTFSLDKTLQPFLHESCTDQSTVFNMQNNSMNQMNQTPSNVNAFNTHNLHENALSSDSLHVNVALNPPYFQTKEIAESPVSHSINNYPSALSTLAPIFEQPNVLATNFLFSLPPAANNSLSAHYNTNKNKNKDAFVRSQNLNYCNTFFSFSPSIHMTPPLSVSSGISISSPITTTKDTNSTSADKHNINFTDNSVKGIILPESIQKTNDNLLLSNNLSSQTIFNQYSAGNEQNKNEYPASRLQNYVSLPCSTSPSTFYYASTSAKDLCDQTTSSRRFSLDANTFPLDQSVNQVKTFNAHSSLISQIPFETSHSKTTNSLESDLYADQYIIKPNGYLTKASSSALHVIRPIFKEQNALPLSLYPYPMMNYAFSPCMTAVASPQNCQLDTNSVQEYYTCAHDNKINLQTNELNENKFFADEQRHLDSFKSCQAANTKQSATCVQVSPNFSTSSPAITALLSKVFSPQISAQQRPTQFLQATNGYKLNNNRRDCFIHDGNNNHSNRNDSSNISCSNNSKLYNDNIQAVDNRITNEQISVNQSNNVDISDCDDIKYLNNQTQNQDIEQTRIEEKTVLSEKFDDSSVKAHNNLQAVFSKANCKNVLLKNQNTTESNMQFSNAQRLENDNKFFKQPQTKIFDENKKVDNYKISAASISLEKNETHTFTVSSGIQAHTEIYKNTTDRSNNSQNISLKSSEENTTFKKESVIYDDRAAETNVSNEDRFLQKDPTTKAAGQHCVLTDKKGIDIDKTDHEKTTFDENCIIEQNGECQNTKRNSQLLNFVGLCEPITTVSSNSASIQPGEFSEKILCPCPSLSSPVSSDWALDKTTTQEGLTKQFTKISSSNLKSTAAQQNYIDKNSKSQLYPLYRSPQLSNASPHQSALPTTIQVLGSLENFSLTSNQPRPQVYMPCYISTNGVPSTPVNHTNLLARQQSKDISPILISRQAESPHLSTSAYPIGWSFPSSSEVQNKTLYNHVATPILNAYNKLNESSINLTPYSTNLYTFPINTKSYKHLNSPMISSPHYYVDPIYINQCHNDKNLYWTQEIFELSATPMIYQSDSPMLLIEPTSIPSPAIQLTSTVMNAEK